MPVGKEYNTRYWNRRRITGSFARSHTTRQQLHPSCRIHDGESLNGSIERFGQMQRTLREVQLQRLSGA